MAHKGVLDQAVIYDPLRQELFTASKGAGANLNNRRIRVSKQKELEGALIGTGFPYSQMDNLEHYLECFRKLCPITAGIRRAGAASLDLAYVACGRLDGFWEFGLKEWDMAAGVLLIRESGGIVIDADKSDNFMRSGNIVASNSLLSAELLNILAH